MRYLAIALLAVAGCARDDTAAERFAVSARLDSLGDRLNQVVIEHNRHLCEEHADRYECIEPTTPHFYCEPNGKCPKVVVRREEIWP